MPRARRPNRAHVTGMVWATRVTSMAMQLAIPAGLGYLADRRWGTAPWLTIVGACVGCLLFAVEIVRLAQGMNSRTVRRPPRSSERH